MILFATSNSIPFSSSRRAINSQSWPISFFTSRINGAIDGSSDGEEPLIIRPWRKSCWLASFSMKRNNCPFVLIFRVTFVDEKNNLSIDQRSVRNNRLSKSFRRTTDQHTEERNTMRDYLEGGCGGKEKDILTHPQPQLNIPRQAYNR